jgi:hypothetical protein
LVANHRIEKLVAKPFTAFRLDTDRLPAGARGYRCGGTCPRRRWGLLVARAEHTPFDVAQRAQAAFSNSRILGFVLNAVKRRSKQRIYYYYYGSEEGGR